MNIAAHLAAERRGGGGLRPVGGAGVENREQPAGAPRVGRTGDQ